MSRLRLGSPAGVGCGVGDSRVRGGAGGGAAGKVALYGLVHRVLPL